MPDDEHVRVFRGVAFGLALSPLLWPLLWLLLVSVAAGAWWLGGALLGVWG